MVKINGHQRGATARGGHSILLIVELSNGNGVIDIWRYQRELQEVRGRNRIDIGEFSGFTVKGQDAIARTRFRTV